MATTNPLYQLPVSAAMYTPVVRLTTGDLTTGVGGTGVFDAIMTSLAAHLKAEFSANRITGAEYTKAYAAMVESALGGAVQYLLGREQAFWAAQNAQITAISARVGLESTAYQLEQLMPQQLALLKEQTEAQRAQTMNTRTDGVTPIVGSLGKQRELYDQQITSYKRDAEVKAAKMFIDTWITQKTINEGLVPPAGLNNASLQTILDVLKTNNNFV